MKEKIFKNYEPFYNMVLSTTIMGNSMCEQLEADSKKIIDFIGEAYKLDKEFVETCKDVILNHLSRLGKTTDQQAVYASRHIEDEYSDTDSLYDIKGDVLLALQHIPEREEYINPGWFDYSHYKSYEPNIRFSKIYITSASGNIITTRQTGILQALGIGTKQCYNQAIQRLLQCARWGDIPSMHYLSYAYKLSGDEKNSKLYDEVASLAEQYLRTGVTVLPECATKNYSEEACSIYVYVSTILQDVIYLHNVKNINYSFLEAIFSPVLDHYSRLDYINNYTSLAWKNVTNSANKPKKLGFN